MHSHSNPSSNIWAARNEQNRFARTIVLKVIRSEFASDEEYRRMLVDEATALKQATLLHHRQNDQAGAYQLVHALADRLRADRDPTLDPERTLVERLEQTLAAASGRGEPTQTASGRSEVSGLPMLVTGG